MNVINVMDTDLTGAAIIDPVVMGTSGIDLIIGSRMTISSMAVRVTTSSLVEMVKTRSSVRVVMTFLSVVIWMTFYMATTSLTAISGSDT